MNTLLKITYDVDKDTLEELFNNNYDNVKKHIFAFFKYHSFTLNDYPCETTFIFRSTIDLKKNQLEDLFSNIVSDLNVFDGLHVSLIEPDKIANEFWFYTKPSPQLDFKKQIKLFNSLNKDQIIEYYNLNF